MFELVLLILASMMLFGGAVEPENTSSLLISKIYGENAAFEPPRFPRGKIYQEIWELIEVPKEPPIWINDLNDSLSEIPLENYFPGPGEGIDNPSYIERTIRKIYELPLKKDQIKLVIEAIKFLYNQEKSNNPDKIKENNAAVIATTETTTTTKREGKRGKISAFDMDDTTKEHKNVTRGNNNKRTKTTTSKPDQHKETDNNNDQTSTTPSKTAGKDEKRDKKDDAQDEFEGNPSIGGGGGGSGLPGLPVGKILGAGIVAVGAVGVVGSGLAGVASSVGSVVGSTVVGSGAAGGLSSGLGGSGASNVGNSGQLGQNLRPSNQANSRISNRGKSNKNNNRKPQQKQKKDKKKKEKDRDDDDDFDFDYDLDEPEDTYTDNDTYIDQQSKAENISELFIAQFEKLDDACEMFKTNFTSESNNLNEFQNKYSSMVSEVEALREKLGEKVDEESSDEIYNEKIKVFNEGYLLIGLLYKFYDHIDTINSSFVANVEAIEYLEFEGYILKYNITEIVLGSESFYKKIYKDVEKVRTITQKAKFRLENCFSESLPAFQNWRLSIESFYQAGIELGRKIFSSLFEQKEYNVKSWSDAVFELKNFVTSAEKHSNLTQSFIDLERTSFDCITKIEKFLLKKQKPILSAIYSHTT